jgi:hypothetical protein
MEMIALLGSVAAAVAAPPNAIPTIGGLEGCWKAPGKVQGKEATSIARGEWHLGRRYFMLHLRSVSRKKPYEASLLYGAGDKPEAINAYWMDSFGGAYSTAGKGTVTNDGFTVVYTYPDSLYTNRFERTGNGWRWTIMEKVPDKPGRLFAEYNLVHASCRGMTFDF